MESDIRCSETASEPQSAGLVQGIDGSSGATKAAGKRTKPKAWYIRQYLATTNETPESIALLCESDVNIVNRLKRELGQVNQRDKLRVEVAQLRTEVRGIRDELAWIRAEFQFEGIPRRPIGKRHGKVG